jgi:hypothetical protein
MTGTTPGKPAEQAKRAARRAHREMAELLRQVITAKVPPLDAQRSARKNLS